MQRFIALGAPLVFMLACGTSTDPDGDTGSGPGTGQLDGGGGNPDQGAPGSSDGGSGDLGPTRPGDINVEVGPEGGTVPTGVDFMVLNVPPGALSEPTTIAVTLLDEAPVDGASPVGPVVQFGPPGLQFAVPASLDFALDDEIDPSQRIVLQQLEAGETEPSSAPMFGATAVIRGFTTFWPELRPQNEAVQIEILSVTPGTEAADSTPEQPRWEADGESVVVTGRVTGSTSPEVLVRDQRGDDFSYAISGITDGEFQLNVSRPEDLAAGLWFATADGGSVIMVLLCGTPCGGDITTLPNEAGEFFTSADPSRYVSEQLYLCDPSVIPVQLFGSDPAPVVVSFMTDDFTDLASPPGFCDSVAEAKDIILRVDSDARARVRVVPPAGFSVRSWFGPGCDAIESGSCRNAARVAMDGGFVTSVVPEVDSYFILSPEISGTDGTPYTVSLQIEALDACPGLRPQGQRPEVCDDLGNLVSCIGEDQTQIRAACPHGCNRDSCNGDTCRNAIKINRFPFNFVGAVSPAGFRRDYETGPDIQASCDTEMLHVGEDAVFEVDLLAGEVLTVESGTTGLVSQRIFIKRTCDGEAECVGSSVPFERIRFEAPEAGTYFVFVDRTSTNSDGFTALFRKE